MESPSTVAKLEKLQDLRGWSLKPDPQAAKYKRTTIRSSAGRGGGGGGGGGVMAVTQRPPVEFSLGPAPTLEGLQIDYETLGKRAIEANKPFAEQYRQMAPQTEAGARALSQAGATMAAGVVPRDVTGQVGRSAAALGFTTGVGARSGMGRNILARDLGLSSLQVQQAGAGLLERSSALAQQAMQAMAPISANQLAQQAFIQDQYNREIANQNLLSAWMSRPLPGQFDVTRGQYVGFQPGTYATTRPLPPGMQLAGGKAFGTQAFNEALQNWTGTIAPSPVYGA